MIWLEYFLTLCGCPFLHARSVFPLLASYHVFPARRVYYSIVLDPASGDESSGLVSAHEPIVIPAHAPWRFRCRSRRDHEAPQTRPAKKG